MRASEDVKRAAIESLVHNDEIAVRNNAEHKRKFWERYINIPLTIENDTVESIESVPSHALTVVLSLMAFARPDFKPFTFTEK